MQNEYSFMFYLSVLPPQITSSAHSMDDLGLGAHIEVKEYCEERIKAPILIGL